MKICHSERICNALNNVQQFQAGRAVCGFADRKVSQECCANVEVLRFPVDFGYSKQFTGCHLQMNLVDICRAQASPSPTRLDQILLTAFTCKSAQLQHFWRVLLPLLNF